MTTATTPEMTAADQKPKNWSDKLGDVLATAYIAMHFVPIATSICWLIYFISGQNDDLMYILAPHHAGGYGLGAAHPSYPDHWVRAQARRHGFLDTAGKCSLLSSESGCFRSVRRHHGDPVPRLDSVRTCGSAAVFLF